MKGKAMTVVKKESAPKKKTARTNQRAILDNPVKSEAPPEKKKGGRRSILEPIVKQLKDEPGEWFIVAKGKIGTIYQTAARLRVNYPGVEAEAHALEDDKDTGECFARWPEVE